MKILFDSYLSSHKPALLWSLIGWSLFVLEAHRISAQTSPPRHTEKSNESTIEVKEQDKPTLVKSCVEQLSRLKGVFKNVDIKKICQHAQQHNGCVSQQNRPIFHFEFPAHRQSPRNILVLSLIHGDETESGAIALRWIERLLEIKSRNRWLIVPVSNPDGFYARTRVNAQGVDLNRNFPSKDWDQHALAHWESKQNRDPRRYPGPFAGSEKETRCYMRQIEFFKPDFIISVHTPYGVLDFDGPKVNFPKFKYLRWTSLGTYPGSLGRYMWKDQNIPVLTIELKDDSLLKEMDQIDKLQDISGTVAIRATHELSNMP